MWEKRRVVDTNPTTLLFPAWYNFYLMLLIQNFISIQNFHGALLLKIAGSNFAKLKL